MITYSGPILILFFLLLTIIISAYEKLFVWNKTLKDYIEMYKNHLPPFLVKLSLIIILGLEIIVTSFLALGIYDLIIDQDIALSEIGLIITGILFLILLIGLRILQDYRGAGRTAIYFLLVVFGLFWIQSI
ncbi:hypothetical protein FNJ87_18065 [Nonlabens mediterrranea]|uniref:DoxX family protein n=1 Tax=Nonlabens mediterrranea TaxID=1419947 RepID=A0ABS0ABF2_9FLAO|nr:hypothetical protein [Nonlabens mediterrranea]